MEQRGGHELPKVTVEVQAAQGHGAPLETEPPASACEAAQGARGLQEDQMEGGPRGRPG